MDQRNPTRTRHEGAHPTPGAVIRAARLALGLTLAQLGARTGYSSSQVSRFERGVTPMTDVVVLRRFADALGIDPRVFGLTERPIGERTGTGDTVVPRLPPPKVIRTPGYDGGDDVRRRQMLAHLAATAAAVAGAPLLNATARDADGKHATLLVAGIRDAMLGLGTHTTGPHSDPVAYLRTGLTDALSDYNACRYRRLAARLPALIRHGHAITDNTGTQQRQDLLAQVYLLATRVLVKLDDQQLGWMAADRARVLADSGAHTLTCAEAARQLAVLARRAGWYSQAAEIALSAADHPDLRRGGPAGTAQRGLLIQSAAYTAARAGDRAGMRELTREAAAVAASLPGTQLAGYGGFSPATVQLHLVSAEIHAGAPDSAIKAAETLRPQALPTVERQARYHSDLATAHAQRGRRDDCVHALLAAERLAPEETHARPAIRALISGLAVTGRMTADLRGLAARCGVL